jgi:hypothetical protein
MLSVIWMYLKTETFRDQCVYADLLVCVAIPQISKFTKGNFEQSCIRNKCKVNLQAYCTFLFYFVFEL